MWKGPIKLLGFMSGPSEKQPSESDIAINLFIFHRKGVVVDNPANLLFRSDARYVGEAFDQGEFQVIEEEARNGRRLEN